MPINDSFQARGEGQQPVPGDDVDAGPAYSPDDQKRFCSERRKESALPII